MTQLTGLHAKFTGDASGFAGAAQQAIGLVDQYGRAVVKVKSAEDQAAAASAKLATEFHKLKMETDGAYAGMQRYQKAADLVTKTARDQKWSVEQLQTELVRLANHYGVAEQAGMNLNQQVRASRFHTANLAAQFNDIGVMMASGQSPFILAIQQGTQVSQVLDNLGGTGKQKLLALKDAFLSVISPTSLLTIGLIAGAAALYQWATAGGEAEEKANAVAEAMKRLAEATATTQDDLDKLTFGVDKEYEARLLREQAQLRREYAAIEREIQTYQATTSDLLSRQKIVLHEMYSELAAIASRHNEITAAIDEQRRLEGALALMENVKRTTAEQNAAYMKRIADQLEAQRQKAQQIHAGMIAQQAAHAAILRQTTANKQMLSEAWKAVLDLNVGLWEGSRAAAALKASGPTGGWLAGAISDAITLANTLWDAAAAASAVRGGSIINKIGRGVGKGMEAVFGSFNPGRLESSPRPGVRPIDWVPGESIGNGSGGGGGGGGGGENPLIAEIEQLREGLMTIEELEAQSYAKRQELLEQAWAQRLITEQEYQSMMEQVNKTHQFTALKNMNEHTRGVLSSLGTLFQGSKKIGAGIALANSWLAFTEVLKDPAYAGRPFARFAAAAAALSSGLNAVKNIKNAGVGGTGGGSSDAGSGGAGGTAAPPIQNVRVTWTGPESAFNSVSALFDIFNMAARNGYRLNTQLVRGSA